MTSKRSFAISRRGAPEVCIYFPPHGGRGECRVPTAPAASCALCSGRTHTSNNEYTGTPDIPARNGFNSLCRALPGDRALLPPSSADMVLSKPGWADLNSANLTPASGRQDHTTSPYAATSLVRSLGDRSRASSTRPATHRAQNAAASTASHPNVRDDRDTPLCGTGCQSSRFDLVRWQQIFFGKSEIKDSTALSTNRPTGKSLEPVLLSTPSVFRMNGSCETPTEIQDVGWGEPAKPIISIKCN